MLAIRSSGSLTKGLPRSRPWSTALQQFSECNASNNRRDHRSEDSAWKTQPHPKQKIRSRVPGLTIRAQLDSIPQKYVSRFNRCLLSASKALYADFQREQLWKAYEDVKQHASAAIYAIPDVAWKRLWKIQCSCRPEDPNRLSGLQSLLADMDTVGLDTKVEREVLRLELDFADGRHNEALQDWTQGGNGKLLDEWGQAQVDLEAQGADGDHEGAIRQWEKCLQRPRTHTGFYKGFSKEWLELGIRLHVGAGKLDRARDLLHNMGRRFHNSDPRFMVFLIQQLNATGHESDVTRAWNLFLSLSKSSTFKMTALDYESTFLSFLKPESTHLAAIVLWSMIKAHKTVLTNQRRIFGGLFRQLLLSSKAPDQIDAVSLLIMETIPQNVSSELFYTTWIECTQRQGDPNRIAEIIELMFEQGKDPHAWHIDSLLKVWFHAGNDVKAGKAENLALEMIQKRTDLEVKYTTLGSFVQDTARKLMIPKFLRRQLPAAGVHTYVQLMGHYARRGDVEAAQHVLKLLTNSTQLKLNGRTVGAILSVHFIMKDFSGAWQFFSHVIQDEFAQVDLRTYGVLWKGLHLNLSINKTASLKGYPSPRELFKHMLKHHVLYDSDAVNSVQQPPPRALYDRIIRCFCLAEDSIGALLALHGMKDMFHQTPTLKTIECLVQHIAHRQHWSGQKRGAHQPLEEHLNVTTDILEFLFAHLSTPERPLRRGAARSAAKRLYSPEFKENRGEDLLNVLSVFLRDYVNGKSRTADRFQRGFDTAKEDMGLDALSHGSVENNAGLVT